MEINKKQKRLIRILWILLISPFILGVIFFALISAGAFGELPGFDELENPKTNIATEVYSSDGRLLGKFFRENRTVVDFRELSPNILNALVATEDARFYDHSGIDWRALMRVAQGIITGNRAGGGSTVTQQLAKNLFRMRKDLKGGNVALTKFKEWVVAVKLERSYTKQEILAMYLNTVDFGSNAFGINSAARTFFDTTPDSLSLIEASVLVGLLKAPTAYSPKINPKRSLERRNVVISQIQKYQNQLSDYHGYKPKTTDYYDSLRNEPITLHYSVQSHTKGIAKHYREYIRQLLTKKKPVCPKNPKKNPISYQRYLSDSAEWANNPIYGWCNKNKKPDGDFYSLYEDGLKIYTTINYDMQRYAEEAVRKHIGGYLQPLFYKRHKGRKKAPFAWQLTNRDIQKILTLSMKRTQRYRSLRKAGKDSAEILKVFKTPVKMRLFTWKQKTEIINGKKEYFGIPSEIDTVLSPWDSIRYYKYFLHAGMMSIEPQTGYVRAYVGDIDYHYFRYDNVSLSQRQVGSTFKPFVYSVAMEDGLSPCHRVPNIPVTFLEGTFNLKEDYTPKYSKNKREGEMVTLKYGLASSLNQISAWIMKKYGPEAVVKMAHKTGIKSYLIPVPSLCVGAAEVKLSEMVGAYDTYANRGVHIEPVFISRIEDKHGNLIAKFTSKQEQAMHEITAFKMIELMKGVVDRGTSVRLRYTYGFKNEIAGKTGTTNDNSDGWFIGMVPNLVTGVWVGGEERSIRFLSSADGQGAAMALPIWAYYMQSVYKNKKLGISDAPFEAPRGFDEDEFDCSKQNQDEDDLGSGYGEIPEY